MFIASISSDNVGTNYDYGNNGTDNLGFHDGTADRLVIAITGKIGINNTNPDYTLDVRAPSGDVWVSARGGTNQGYQVRKSDNTLIINSFICFLKSFFIIRKSIGLNNKNTKFIA